MKRLFCVILTGILLLAVACKAAPAAITPDGATDAPQNAATEKPLETPIFPVFTQIAIPTDLAIDPGLIRTTPPPVGIYDPTPELSSESVTPAPDDDN